MVLGRRSECVRIMRPFSSKSRKEKGAVLVELAMIVPVLTILVMGIVDYGAMFSEKISLRNGVRESSWNSARSIYGSEQDCALTFDGAEPNKPTQQTMCMTKYRSELPHEPTRVKLIFVNLENPAVPGNYEAGAGLMVCAMHPARSTTKFFSALLDGKAQKARLTNIIIGESLPGLEEAEETPLPGQDWSWCDPTLDPPG